jgi:hypothetical protein
VSLSRKRLNRQIAASCIPVHRRAVAVVVQGGMPQDHAPAPLIETVVVRKEATWIVRGGVPPLPREPDIPARTRDESA